MRDFVPVGQRIALAIKSNPPVFTDGSLKLKPEYGPGDATGGGRVCTNRALFVDSESGGA